MLSEGSPSLEDILTQALTAGRLLESSPEGPFHVSSLFLGCLKAVTVPHKDPLGIPQSSGSLCTASLAAGAFGLFRAPPQARSV